MYQKFSDFIRDKKRICIIQAENPDGDSLGSATALDYALKDLEVSLYCPVDMPKYLYYFQDAGRVTNEFDFKADGYIIVDTAAKILLSKVLDDNAISNRLFGMPVLVIDHHETEDDLDFPHEKIIETRPACTELIYDILKECGIDVPVESADAILMGIMSDTLGLTSASVTAHSFNVCAELLQIGSNIAELEEKRREFMKKSPRIMDYKADLMKRVDFSLDNALATVHIPWDEIAEFSDEYNPNVLILEELRMVEGVRVAVAIKTYPDGKVTGKIRTMGNANIAEKIAGYFGGGGHEYAAGFRTYDTNYEEVLADLVRIVPEFLADLPEPERRVYEF